MKLTCREPSTHSPPAPVGRHGAPSRADNRFSRVVDARAKVADKSAEGLSLSEARADDRALGSSDALASAARFAFSATHAALHAEVSNKLEKPPTGEPMPTASGQALSAVDQYDLLSERGADAPLRNAPRANARDAPGARSIATPPIRSSRPADAPGAFVEDAHSERHLETAQPPVVAHDVLRLPVETQSAGDTIATSGRATPLALQHPPPSTGGDGAKTAPTQTPPASTMAPPDNAASLPGPTHSLRLSISSESAGAATLALKIRGDALDLRLRVAEPAALKAVENGREDLGERLRTHGYVVERLQFDLAPQPATGAASDPSGGGERARREPEPDQSHARRSNFREDAQDGEAPVVRRSGVYL